MIVAVIGSRKFPAPDLVGPWVRRMHARFGDAFAVVSGACRDSPDVWSVMEARLDGVPDARIEEIPAKWHVDGKVDNQAGFKRNSVVVQRCEMVLAFWTGSGGTKDTLCKAVAQDKPVIVVRPDGAVESWKPGDDLPAWYSPPRW